jgi:ParB-like chromosome segregation protein Spo0J
MTTEYPIHPAADLFPMMTPEEYEALKEDIRQHGQHEWATLLDGKIIDGRNRYRACRELGIETEFCELDVRDHPQPFDPVAFVLSKNLYRRHLTREQRNQLMLDLRAMGKTCREIATATGVNKATVSRVVANATTESPATVKGKDGKEYPTKKAGRRERRADPAGYEQFKKDAAAYARQAKKQLTAKPTATAVDTDRLCPVCEVRDCVAGQDRCQECLDEPDDDVVVVQETVQGRVARVTLDDFIRLWNVASEPLKETVRAYVATH